ncbi:hypothetical protein [Streptomyces atratus]
MTRSFHEIESPFEPGRFTPTTRYDKRAYVFYGTVTVTAIRLWLRP